MAHALRMNLPYYWSDKKIDLGAKDWTPATNGLSREFRSGCGQIGTRLLG